MTPKSLKDLLSQADAVLGLQPVSGQDFIKRSSDENESGVLAFADILSSAGAPVFLETAPQKKQGLDKLAESLNISLAAKDIADLVRVENFRASAEKEGFPKEQVDEALSKVAMSNFARQLSALVKIGAALGTSIPRDKRLIDGAGVSKRRRLTKSHGY